MKKNLILLSCILFLACSSSAQEKKDETIDTEFSFIFMTDIHTTPMYGASDALKLAADTANKLNADFVLTGGDNVYDVMRGNFEKSDSLFLLYKKSTELFNMPFHHTIGNHELFGIYKESDVDSTHPDYKYGMFERYFGDSYYSFDHKGWHFISLNSLDVRNKRYYGTINAKELKWLKGDLAKLDKNTPIAIAMHVPLVSAFRQRYPDGEENETSNSLWISNRKEVLDLFADYNLRLVLQGHKHWIEDVMIQRHGHQTHFITGGALAGRPSWRGTRNDEEGFMLIHVNGEEISWEYIDIGWEAQLRE